MGTPPPQKRLRHLLLGAPTLAWPILCSQHLSVPLQTVPATLMPSYPVVFLRGDTGDRLSYSFSPI